MILAWLLIVFVIIVIHVHIIKVEKRSPDKLFWLVIRCVLAGILIIIEWKLQLRSLPLLCVSYFFAGWVPHDTIIAMALKKFPWYTNKTGTIDKRQGSNPMIWLIKMLGLITTFIMYWLNEV